jgi:CMP-N-acetylneuraminic acid synthetase
MTARDAAAIALIPARGGSKGIPRKNLAAVGGRSLLERAIDAARASGAMARICVSSDDQEILAAAVACGVEALERPARYATDTASSDDVIAHFVEGARPQVQPDQPLVLLQPTSPLRSGAHVAEALRLWRSGDAAAVVSVFEPDHHPAKAFRLDERGFLQGLFSDDAPFVPRQSLPRAFQPNGAVYVFSAAEFLRERRIPRARLVPLVMSGDESLDIDCAADLVRAQHYLEGRTP